MDDLKGCINIKQKITNLSLHYLEANGTNKFLAKKEKNLAIQDDWIAFFGKIRGKFSHSNYIQHVTCRKSGSMNIHLFARG